jgi:HAD superfamily hydrolase (TIGR01509 family)
MFKAYVFDFEGTLVDFQWNLDDGLKATKAKLEEMGFDKERLMKTDSYAKLYNDAVIDALMRRVALSSSEVREKIGEVWDYWDLDAATRWQLRENARDTLNRLHRRATVGLYTSVGRKAVMKVLERYEVDRLFHIVITRNDTTLIKPYNEGLRLVLDFLEISPEEMLFIGDSVKDIAAAEAIGAQSAFLVGGEQELPPDVKPDHIIYSMSDIVKIK